MSKYAIFVFFLIATFFIPEANGVVIRNYYSDYGLPGTPYKGRPYRENGRIKYEYNYPAYSYPANYPQPYYKPGRVYRDAYGRKVYVR